MMKKRDERRKHLRSHSYTQFHSGDKVVSLVYHPPEIVSGTEAVIVSPYVDELYAVQLPSGELHRWFAGFELQPVKNSECCLNIGDRATITTNKGHPPMIEVGTTVKIIKVISNARFYDLRLNDGKYHRWLAEFEIAPSL
jgi:hypothetical protein